MYCCPFPIIHKKTDPYESVFLVFKAYFRMNLSSEGRCGIVGRITFHVHVKVILVPKRGQLTHHGRCMVHVQGFLAGPGVDEEDGLRIVEGLEVTVLQVALFGADGGSDAARFHLFRELLRVSVFTGVVKVDGNAHKSIEVLSVCLDDFLVPEEGLFPFVGNIRQVAGRTERPC